MTIGPLLSGAAVTGFIVFAAIAERKALKRCVHARLSIMFMTILLTRV